MSQMSQLQFLFLFRKIPFYALRVTLFLSSLLSSTIALDEWSCESSHSYCIHLILLTSFTSLTLQANKDFSWDNYGGLKDFYASIIPKWQLVGWVWQKPEEWTEEEWQLFEMWAEEKWDQKEDWSAYTDEWTDDDWLTFKTWMDAEYKEYMTDHMPLHQDTFIR